MHVAINGYFLQRPMTGSGQYTIGLLRESAALRPGDRFTVFGGRERRLPFAAPGVRVVACGPPVDGRLHNLRKVAWELVGFPARAAVATSDLLHTPYWAPPLAASRPVVVTIHDVIPALWREYRGGRLGAAYTRLVSATARGAAAILVDSECSRQDAVRLLGVRADRVHTVYLAAGERFHPVEDARATAVANRLGIDGPYFLYLGATDKRKDVPTLLRAWQQAGPRLPGRSLVIGGFIPPHASALYPDLPELVAELGIADRVTFLGPVAADDQVALLSGCVGFVFPSRYEGFGLPPLEAMACGAPVVAAGASSLPEVVGDAGLLFPPGDAAALAHHLIRLGEDDDLRARLGAAARERAATFTWRRTAEQTLGVYDRVLSGR